MGADDSHDSVIADAPRVEALIASVMARHPGIDVSPKRAARYFEEVHQELAPLARSMERDIGVAECQVGDLALLVGRLVRALRKADPESELPDIAMEYMRRSGLVSPLRRLGKATYENGEGQQG